MKTKETKLPNEIYFPFILKFTVGMCVKQWVRDWRRCSAAWHFFYYIGFLILNI